MFQLKRGRKDQEQWERHVKALIEGPERIIPIRERPLANKAAPFIVNMVGTVCILPQEADAAARRYRLSLESLAMHLGPCSQYAPLQFAANILKITNSTTDSTTLVFGSGKLVLVSALSEWHMRYMSHLFRILIERVECTLVDAEGRLSVGTLAGRTIFEKNMAHNIVGHGDFGFKVNLKALRDANPEAVHFVPDGFPAAKASVWLTPDRECHCGRKERRPIVPSSLHGSQSNPEDDDEEVKMTLGKVIKNSKCPCTIKCLVFKSGRMVLIGARRPQDINAVFYRIMELVQGFRANNNHFYKALGSVFVQGTVATKREKAKIRGERELSETEAVALAVAGARSFKSKKSKVLSATTVAQKARLTPLMRLAEAGRLDQVKMTLEMDPAQLDLLDEHGQTALDRLANLPERTFEQNLVLDYLASLFEK